MRLVQNINIENRHFINKITNKRKIFVNGTCKYRNKNYICTGLSNEANLKNKNKMTTINIYNEKFPAFVTLENGKEKLMNNPSDAYSWSKSLKSDIIKVSTFEVSAPKNYNPSNESIKESNRLLGGSDSDFVDGF